MTQGDQVFLRIVAKRTPGADVLNLYRRFCSAPHRWQRQPSRFRTLSRSAAYDSESSLSRGRLCQTKIEDAPLPHSYLIIDRFSPVHERGKW